MNSYSLHITGTAQEKNLNKGIFLFIYRASKIPPHVGIIVNGLLYDITSVGPTIGLPLSDFYKTALKRKTEVLFVKLKVVETLTLNEHAASIMKEHFKVTLKKSCLIPVKAFIQKTYGVNVQEKQFIFELLPLLKQKEILEGVFELNLSKKVKNGCFIMSKYTQKEVEKCIAALNRKDQFSC
jgi:hypothetical protein